VYTYSEINFYAKILSFQKTNSRKIKVAYIGSYKEMISYKLWYWLPQVNQALQNCENVEKPYSIYGCNVTQHCPGFCYYIFMPYGAVAELESHSITIIFTATTKQNLCTCYSELMKNKPRRHISASP
jgi:hypothetical protein